MAYATVADVIARMGRPLTAAESAQAEVFLNDVELLIKTRIPDLDQKITDGEIEEGIVVMVEANAVMRILKNPDAKRQEADGNYSYSLDTRAASGFLLITNDEWDWLGYASGAFTIVPYIESPPALVDPADWETG